MLARSSLVTGRRASPCARVHLRSPFLARWRCSKPEAKASFADFVRPELVQTLRRMGCVAPNTMQARALSLGVAGEDVLVSAQTGAGKTLVFLLPLLQRLSMLPKQALAPPAAADALLAPVSLVIVPTPELVAQVAWVAEELTAALPNPFVIGRAAGSHTDASTIAAAQLLVTTPEEVVRRKLEGTLSTAALQVVAIDEADSILCGELHGTEQLPPLEAELLSGEGGCEGRGEGGGDVGMAPQFLLTTATLSDAHEEQLLRRFPAARRVSHTGVLVPTLRQRFHYFRGCKDGELIKVSVTVNVTVRVTDARTKS